MSRHLTILLAISVVITAVWYFWPVDSETAIRRVLDRLERSFDNASPRRLASHFAEDWSDPPTGADRDALRAAFAWFVTRERDPKRRQFTYDIDYDDDATSIEVVSDTEATVAMVLIVSRILPDGGLVLEWRVSVRAVMKLHRGRWLIQESERKTLEGRRPF